MKDKQLYLYWLYLYIICATLGFIPQERNPLVAALLAILTLVFFVPPAILLYRGIQQQSRPKLTRIALLSALSLGLTTLLFIANMLTVLAPNDLLLGNVFNALLILVSAPMMCAPYQIISLFMWACLLVVALRWQKTTPKKP